MVVVKWEDLVNDRTLSKQETHVTQVVKGSIARILNMVN